MEYIKMLDPIQARRLAGMGFCYIKEQINKQDVYCFRAEPELLEILSNQFSDKQYFTESILRF